MVMTITVLHLVRALQVGGLEDVVVNLVNGLASSGVECHVGCLVEEGEWIGRTKAKGIWVGQLGHTGKARVLLGLCDYLRRHGITLIHSHNPQPHAFAVAASLATGVPVVHTKHGRNFAGQPNARRVWLNRQLARFSKRIVAVSDDAARVSVEIEGVPEEKVIVIRNGVDVERFGAGNRGQGSGVRGQASGTGGGDLEEGGQRTETRRRLGIPMDGFVIGSVGRFSPEKNYPLLVRGFARFCGQMSGSTPTLPYPREAGRQVSGVRRQREEESAPSATPTLLLVGDGPDRARIEQTIAECGVRRQVVLAGMQADVVPWLGVMDVFCLSSVTEGTSITLLEAGAAGLPCVVTRVGGNAEIVEDGQTGMAVPSQDVAALTQAFDTLYSGPDLRHRMGLAARARVEQRYSLQSMVCQYAALYEAVM
jgi:glycosyltransferase involved in cell wall biosynthesis